MKLLESFTDNPEKVKKVAGLQYQTLPTHPKEKMVFFQMLQYLILHKDNVSCMYRTHKSVRFHHFCARVWSLVLLRMLEVILRSTYSVFCTVTVSRLKLEKDNQLFVARSQSVLPLLLVVF